MEEQRKTERDLVLELKAAGEAVDVLDASLKKAKEKEEAAEAALIELLEANQAEATAHYDGVGYFRMVKPRLYASVTKENQEKLFSFLQEIGRDDLIKQVVMPQTLSTFVKERIENGEPVPDYVSTYFKQSLKLIA
jgi:hypothetical protein